MRTFILFALTVFAFLAVAQAETDDNQARVMQTFADIKKFFAEDPAGIKIKDIAQETCAFAQQVRMKVRAALRQYLKNLLNEN
nr:AntigenB like protein [Hymenolepis microstoma]